MSKIFTIPFGQCFLKTLAHFICNHLTNDVNETDRSPFSSASTQIWLPTNRSVMGFKESLIQESANTVVLPTLCSLTDLESKNPFFLKEIDELPRAINSFEHLALVMDFLPQSLHVKKAFAIADYLVKLHNECVISCVSVEKLESLFDVILFDTAPAHVKDAFKNLHILTHHLPKTLKKRSVVTEAWRRQQAMKIINTELQNNPPAHPLIIAGTTGTIPTTRELLKTVYHLPNGIIVLPGLENSYEIPHVAKMPSHPQHTLFDLCAYLGLSPRDIPELTLDDSVSRTRRQNLKVLFNTPPFKTFEKSIDTPTLIECASQAEEVRVIAAIVREKLFTTNHSIAIVTPNTILAQRIQAEFSLYGIVANDSAGTPLKQTPVGSFLSNIVTFLKNPTNAALIQLAKHPLCEKANRADHLTFIRGFECYLRKKQHSWHLNTEPSFVTRLKAIVLKRKSCKTFYEFIRFLKETCFDLSSKSVFKDSDGESADAFFNELVKSAPKIVDFEDGFITLMDLASPIHDHEGIGARVRILGTLEARLNTADVVICASLNEGNWPKNPENDPLLSDNFRLKIGLPSQKRRQGLAAHDFCTSFYAPNLYFTRALREGGETTLQSRLWTRAKECYGFQPSIYRQLANCFTEVKINPCEAPKPKPITTDRPNVFYASHIEQLIQDPYAYYTRHLLKLDPLPKLDETLSAKDKGKIFHSILDGYLKMESEPALEKLIDFSKSFFNVLDEKSNGISQTFWWYRFKRIATWWHDKLDHELVSCRLTEVLGETNLMIDNFPVVLKSRADRIEKLISDHKLRIIDYKTGTLPTRKSIKNGTSPQLLIEAIIANNSGFGDDFASDHDFQLEYWRLTGAEPAGESLSFDLSFDEREETKNKLLRLLRHYLQNNSPYLATGSNSDSHFFSRLEEWESYI